VTSSRGHELCHGGDGASQLVAEGLGYPGLLCRTLEDTSAMGAQLRVVRQLVEALLLPVGTDLAG